MNSLDALMLIPLLWGAWRGFKKGFVFEVALVMALFLGTMGGVQLSDYASGYLRDAFNVSSRLLPYLSFAVVFLAIVVLIMLFARLLEEVLKIVALGLLNRITGSVLGVVKWAFLLSVVLHLSTPLAEKSGIISLEKKKQSLLYPCISAFAPVVVPAMKKMTNEYYSRFSSAVTMLLHSADQPVL